MGSNHVALKDIAFLDLWVEDAQAVVEAYREFGFDAIAEAGPETGFEGHHSIAIACGEIVLIVTSALDAVGPVAEFTRRHGDGVRDIAFAVDDVDATYRNAIARGASVVHASRRWGADGGPRATIAAFGDVVHSFVHFDRRQPLLPPVYRPVRAASSTPALFRAIDHVAMCLEVGTLGGVAEFYKRVLGFEDGHMEYVETELSGMRSIVVQRGPLKFPLQEPLRRSPSGPIADFVALNRGSGVEHVGLLTDDIVKSLRSIGPSAKPLPTPSAYYEALPMRVGGIDESLDDLQALNILVDREASGYLLQVFTRSLHERGTLFFEVIQRKGGARSFGSSNIRALFDAVESDRRTVTLSKECRNPKSRSR